MILCNKNCHPCCYFCIYTQYGSPIRCTRYNDEEHNNLVFDSSFCNEFHCNLAEWPGSWYLISLEDWVHEQN